MGMSYNHAMGNDEKKPATTDVPRPFTTGVTSKMVLQLTFNERGVGSTPAWPIMII